MPQALWNGVVIAESDATEMVEGDHYFPPDSVKREFLEHSGTKSVCPWKGTASYYHINVNGDINTDAAFYYPEPTTAAENIRGYIAFWKGVEVQA
jgi:uncharacterized protein (DUF427 family)